MIGATRDLTGVPHETVQTYSYILKRIVTVRSDLSLLQNCMDSIGPVGAGVTGTTAETTVGTVDDCVG